jgi:RNA polymerase sigma-70 factor (ECF subfamily)
MTVPATEEALDALMERLAEGDRAAFDPLFRAFYPRAVRLCRARLGNGHAEDAAQSALLKVFAKASDFEIGRPVLPWFYAIVANEVRSLRRSLRLGESEACETEEPAAETDPEQLFLRAELEKALQMAIAALDEEAAIAIHAVLEQGPRPEISPVAFRKRVSRVYARLRLLLGGSYGSS